MIWSIKPGAVGTGPAFRVKATSHPVRMKEIVRVRSPAMWTFSATTMVIA